jgi:hypothetical protein
MKNGARNRNVERRLSKVYRLIAEGGYSGLAFS